MNAQRIQTVFRTLGKLIRLSDMGVANASGVKAHLAAVERQMTAYDDSADPYRELTTFLAPLVRSFQPVTQSLDRVSMMSKAAADNLLRAVASEFSQPTTATPVAVVNSLKASMLTNAQTVAPSGRFWRFVNDNYSIELPQASSPTVNEEWVTSTVIFPS